jgi:hypothetical protein
VKWISCYQIEIEIINLWWSNNLVTLSDLNNIFILQYNLNKDFSSENEYDEIVGLPSAFDSV